MMSCDGWKIEVVNWASYNPRSETKRPTWFRFENDIALGDGFHGLNCEIKWVWVIILSLVSKKNGDTITWNAAYVESISGITEPTQRKAIEIFEKFTRLHVTRTEACETRALRTNVRTNETNETNKDSPTGLKPAAPPVPPEILKEFEPVRSAILERSVPLHIQQRWLDAYPDPSWVVRQIKEAALWEATNPTRRKKNFAAFISRWLAKGWDHRPAPAAAASGPVIPPRLNKKAADEYGAELDNFLAGVMNR